MRKETYLKKSDIEKLLDEPERYGYIDINDIDLLKPANVVEVGQCKCCKHRKIVYFSNVQFRSKEFEQNVEKAMYGCDILKSQIFDDFYCKFFENKGDVND